MPDPLTNLTIVSGGQTGADRAALDFAIGRRLSHGGWCPLGRRAEDGPIASCYQLRETPSRRYPQRTQWNVRDSDGTLALTISPTLQGGTALTIRLAGRLGKPWLHLARDAESGSTAASEHLQACAERLLHFLRAHHVRRLNVAGPRASQEPEIGTFVQALFTAAWEHAGRLPEPPPA